MNNKPVQGVLPKTADGVVIGLNTTVFYIREAAIYSGLVTGIRLDTDHHILIDLSHQDGRDERMDTVVYAQHSNAVKALRGGI